MIFKKVNQCPIPARSSTQTERDLVKQLKEKRSIGYLAFLENHSSTCGMERMERFTRNERVRRDIATAFAGINVIVGLNPTCKERGSKELNTLRMCKECSYDITLPNEYMQRYHSYVTCDSGSSNAMEGDYSCLYGEGTCLKREVIKPIVKLKPGKSWKKTKRDDLEVVNISFTIGCNCQVTEGSIFELFV